MVYIIIFFFSIIMGYVFSNYVIVKKGKKWHNVGYQKGYHIHHSVYGLLLFFLTPLTFHNFTKTIIVIGFGAGIIVEHTIHEGFVFIERVVKNN